MPLSDTLFVKPLDGGSSRGFPVEDFPRSAVMIERSVKRYGRLLIERESLDAR